MIVVVQCGKYGDDGSELFVAREKDGSMLIEAGGKQWHFDARGAYLPHWGDATVLADVGIRVEVDEETTQETVLSMEPRKAKGRFRKS